MRAQGFTMVELIAVMLVIGVLAAVGIPRLVDGYGNAPQVYRDQVISALRIAKRNATTRRRVVCVTASDTAMVLRVSTQAGIPGNCAAPIAGIEDGDYRSSRDGVTSAASVGFAGTTGVLYFLPDGSISIDSAGLTPAVGNVAIRAGRATQFTIAVDGRTGHVE
jgi:MSHA pilin protein MshC